ncbi:MAG: ABC transporter ATP-binding protein [Cytophagales bacterium]
MLKALNISKKFGEINVLNNINLEVKKGSIVSIYGKSGAGKSTLLYILSTLDEADNGEVFFDNVSSRKLSGNKLSEFRNKRIGFIFQFHNLLEEFNVLENVCVPGYVSKRKNSEVEAKAKELLKILDLSERINHKPSQLSGGEQQRVAIARSLINSPDIIFADEPTGNLDEENSKNFINLIKKLNTKFNQTFIIVTHNKNFIKVSDFSYTIDKGKLS